MPNGSICHFAYLLLFVIELVVGGGTVGGDPEEEFGFLDFVVGDGGHGGNKKSKE